MLRNGHRLCRVLNGGWATRWQFFSSAKSEQSLNYQLNQANEDVEADSGTRSKVLEHVQARSSRAVIKRPKPLTREPFVKNLFLGKFDTVSCILCLLLACLLAYMLHTMLHYVS